MHPITFGGVETSVEFSTSKSETVILDRYAFNFTEKYYAGNESTTAIFDGDINTDDWPN